MSIEAVILDTTPLGLVTQRAGKSAIADTCRHWMEELLANGVRVYVPEIADYELRRELIREKKFSSISRLDRLTKVLRFILITTPVMHQAAELWAQ